MQPVGKLRIITALASQPPRFTVVVAIVRKQAFRVYGLVRTTVVSVATTSAALESFQPRSVDEAHE
jgi:hypothetical protein